MSNQNKVSQRCQIIDKQFNNSLFFSFTGNFSNHLRSILWSLPDDDLYLILSKAKELFEWAPATSKVTITIADPNLKLQVEQLKRKVEELEISLANANNTNKSPTVCSSPNFEERNNVVSKGKNNFRLHFPNLKFLLTNNYLIFFRQMLFSCKPSNASRFIMELAN